MSTVSEWEIERVWESERVWEWLLSIEMKTKVVQHVKSEWMRDWKSVRVTFEHRDENKSCSACPEWVNERVQVLQVCQVPRLCLTFRHFYDFNGHKRNDFSHLCIVNYRVYKVGPPLSNFFVAELFDINHTRYNGWCWLTVALPVFLKLTAMGIKKKPPALIWKLMGLVLLLTS